MILDDDSRGSAVKTGDVHGPAGTVAAPILPTRTVAADDPHITVDGPVLAMPTGPVLPASSPARTILQAVVILAAALVAGLMVFFVVKSVVTDGDRRDIAQTELDDESLIAPGPGDPGEEGRFGSKRSSVDGDGGQRAESDAFVPGVPTDGDAAPWQDVDPAGPVSGGAVRSSGNADPVAGSDDVLSVGATTGTTAPGAPNPANPNPDPRLPAGAPTPPVMTPSGASPVIAAGSTTSAAQASPTAASGPAPAATATPAPTSTSTTPSVPVDLIVAPTAGLTSTWESPLRVQAAIVPGAKRYCWTIEGARSARSCSTDPSIELPGGRRNIGPGPVTLTVEAIAGGDVLMTEKISLNLIRRDLVKKPVAGAAYALDKRVRLSAAKVPSATSYCWSLSRGSLSSDQICSADPKLDLPANSTSLAAIGAGSATVEVIAYAGTDVVGHQQIAIELLGN